MASIVGVAGTAEGRHFALGEHRVVSIGRDDTCTYQILDQEISRQHLQIRLEHGRHVAADYRSANGVCVNGTRIVSPVVLADGDVIEIGHAKLVYTTADFDDAESAIATLRKTGEWNQPTLPGD